MTVPVADRGPQIAGVATLFVILSTIAIILRCYCRAFVVKSFGLDDWFAVIAWVFFVFFVSFCITGVYHGTGQHVDALPLAEIPVGLKWWWACEPVYVLANMALKFSIGIFLLRISVKKTYTVIIWTVIVVVELYSAAFFFLFVLQCRPSAYFWTQYTGGEGSCIDPKITVNATYAFSAVSCAADWTLGILPIFLVWNLQMNFRTKLSVAAILAVGAIASSATIIRIPFVKDMANQADFLYATSDVAIWSTVETGIGITASAAATLRPLFRAFLSSSLLTGGSSNDADASKNWPRSGYIRSRGLGGAEGFGLRSDIGKGGGVTTVIGADAAGDVAGGDVEMGLGRSASKAGRGGWNDSESKLTDGSSIDDGAWRKGIIKTTGTTQMAD